MRIDPVGDILSTSPEAMQLALSSIARFPSSCRREIDSRACRKLLLAALSPQVTLVQDGEEALASEKHW
jgi:hypothetical protein